MRTEEGLPDTLASIATLSKTSLVEIKPMAANLDTLMQVRFCHSMNGIFANGLGAKQSATSAVRLGVFVILFLCWFEL